MQIPIDRIAVLFNAHHKSALPEHDAQLIRSALRGIFLALTEVPDADFKTHGTSSGYLGIHDKTTGLAGIEGALVVYAGTNHLPAEADLVEKHGGLALAALVLRLSGPRFEVELRAPQSRYYAVRFEPAGEGWRMSEKHEISGDWPQLTFAAKQTA